MSDQTYETKVITQRITDEEEMRHCAKCRQMTSPSRSLHLVSHRDTEEIQATARSRQEVEALPGAYSHDAPSEHYPYKQKGMAAASAMHPSRWRKAKEQ